MAIQLGQYIVTMSARREGVESLVEFRLWWSICDKFFLAIQWLTLLALAKFGYDFYRSIVLGIVYYAGYACLIIITYTFFQHGFIISKRVSLSELQGILAEAQQKWSKRWWIQNLRAAFITAIISGVIPKILNSAISAFQTISSPA